MVQSPTASFTPGQWRTLTVTFVDTSATASPAPSTSRLDAEPHSDPTEPYLCVLVIKLGLLPAPEPTKDQLFTLMVHQWAQGKAADPSHADRLIDRLVKSRALQTEVQALTEFITHLPPEEQALAIELVASGAFTRRELREPGRIATYFARPDWTGIVKTWRQSPHREIGQVIQGMEAALRRQKAKEDTTPPPPAKATKDGRRDTRDDLVTQLKALLPRSLRNWATDFAEGLRAMAADTCAAWDANTIAAAIKRRRMGTGTKICHRTVAAGLPHLVQLGYVTIEGDRARIRPGAFV